MREAIRARWVLPKMSFTVQSVELMILSGMPLLWRVIAISFQDKIYIEIFGVIYQETTYQKTRQNDTRERRLRQGGFHQK